MLACMYTINKSNMRNRHISFLPFILGLFSPRLYLKFSPTENLS